MAVSRDPSPLGRKRIAHGDSVRLIHKVARPHMNEMRVNRKGADRVLSGHPWVFSSDVAEPNGAQPGEA